jgi:phage-related protein
VFYLGNCSKDCLSDYLILVLCQVFGEGCHELRIRDADKNWRIIYRIDDDAILIVEVFNKSTRATPKNVIEVCKKRLSKYDAD